MPNDRERFSPGELAVVLSRFDTGVIESAREYARGSRHSPKLLLRTADGRYLLKRRAHGRDKPERVEFSHRMLRYLREKHFPVPALRPTRDTQEWLVRHEGHIYELFEFVPGERFDGSLEQTYAAGRKLAKFHTVVGEFETIWRPSGTGYHDSPLVRQGLNLIPTSASAHDSVIGHEAELLGTTQWLYERYDDAARAVHDLGYPGWTQWIVHGDWHPGNVLFSGGRVTVVLDFDSARVAPRIADVANGMLQFSILRNVGQPEAWPEFFDLTRMRRFWAGYLSRTRLDPPERRAVPHLMLESLVAECVFPIAATGSFAQRPGFGVLQMVRRKVTWLLDNAKRIEPWLLE